MGERDDLVVARKDHLMLADNGAAAHGVNANLAFFALFALCVAIVHILRFAVAHGSKRIGKHQSRAARRINLLVVVLFDDLNVELVAEHLCRLFCKLQHQVNAE